MTDNSNKTKNTFEDYNILKRCDKLSYVDQCKCTVDGYIHEHEKKLDWIIPSVINNLCINYHFEIENKILENAFNFYKYINSNNNNNINKKCFTGKELIFQMKNYLLINKNDINIITNDYIINELNHFIKYDYIKLISYTTSFFLLNDNDIDYNINDTSIQNSDNYRYHFTKDKLVKFNQHLNINNDINDDIDIDDADDDSDDNDSDNDICSTFLSMQPSISSEFNVPQIGLVNNSNSRYSIYDDNDTDNNEYISDNESDIEYSSFLN